MQLQAGFTLLEMLIAAMIFITGFMAVYGLFLGGLKFRSEADLITRSAVASSNIVSELRLGIRDMDNVQQDFQAYHDQPGLYYRINHAVAIGQTPGRKLSIDFVQLTITADTMSEDNIRRRFRRRGDGPDGPSIIELVERGIIQRYPVVIYPR